MKAGRDISRRSLIRGIAAVSMLGLAPAFGGCRNTSSSKHDPEGAGNTKPRRATLPKKLAIIHTNDMHGYFSPAGDVLGLAAVKRLAADYAEGKEGEELPEEDKYEVLLFDAGDAIQGNLMASHNKGEFVPGLMNAVGYDAMALGNHEFEYGSEVLKELIAACDFPVLSANVYEEGTGKLFTRPNATFTLSTGAKVGVFGLTTPATVELSPPSCTEGLRFLAGEKLYACAQEQIDELESAGCALIVCLGHLGEREADEPNRAIDVVRNTTGLDLFINGHDHMIENVIVPDAQGIAVPIVEAGCWLGWIGAALFEEDLFGEHRATSGFYLDADSDIAELVSQAQDRTKLYLDQLVGHSSFMLEAKRAPGIRDQETPLGDFCADALLWMGSTYADEKPDAALLNGAGMRTNMPKGNICVGDLHDIMPYNNQLCTIRLTGADLLAAVESSTQCAPEETGGFPQVAGIRYQVDTRIPYSPAEPYPDSKLHAPAKPGERVTIFDVGGRGFDLEETYTIVTLNYIAHGGDTYRCIPKEVQERRIYLDYVDYEGLWHYLADGLNGHIPEVYQEPQGRISILQ